MDSLSSVRGGGICEANDGEVVKTVTFKPLSRARKERAPGIPCGMMQGKASLCSASPLLVEGAFYFCFSRSENPLLREHSAQFFHARVP